MKPFRMKVRLYNNRLIRAREEIGLTIGEAAERAGVSYSLLCALEGLRKPAWRATGWSQTATRLATFYGHSPEFLWPEEIANVKKQAVRHLELDAEDMHVLSGGEYEARELAAHVRMAMKRLTPVKAKVLTERFVNERDLRDVGTDFDVSPERVRQIQNRAVGDLVRELRKQGAVDDPIVVGPSGPVTTTVAEIDGALVRARKVAAAEAGRRAEIVERTKGGHR